MKHPSFLHFLHSLLYFPLISDIFLEDSEEQLRGENKSFVFGFYVAVG